MIDKEYPMWVNFHNLDTENLKEIKDFVYLHYPFLAMEGISQEGLWQNIKNYQDRFRTKQKKIRWLVNMWLDEVIPALKTRPDRLKILDANPSEFARDTEERKIGIFVHELNTILLDARWKITVNNNVLEREYFYPPEGDMLGIQDSLLYFIEAILENPEIQRCKIQRCKRNGCKNIFLKLGNPESRNKRYCSDKCSDEAKKERDLDTTRQNAAPIHQVLDYLIKILVETWQKQNEYDEWLEKGITASELIDEFENLLDEYSKDKKRNCMKREEKYYKNGVEITFLGDNRSAQSLGRLLLEKEKQKHSIPIKPKQSILIKVEKRKPINRYRFPITQPKEVMHDADLYENADLSKNEGIIPPLESSEKEEIKLEDAPHFFDTKILEELMKYVRPPEIGYLVMDEE